MPKPIIFVVDDDADIRLALSMLLMAEGYRVVEADGPPQFKQLLERQTPDLILLDMNFSYDTTSGEEGLALLEHIQSIDHLRQKRIPCVLMTAWGNIELAVKGMQRGAVDFIEKPWKKSRLLSIIDTHTAPDKPTETLSASQCSTDWVAESDAMQALDALVEQIAPTDANILILGENGTGKSALAARIHRLSERHQQPLVSVNMGAVPENLFESELFGHKKGAFTDAKEHRQGRFALAEAGTLFLDEIGTLPIAVQPKLLRVLETGEYEVLGASQTQRANVRIVSATNADLQTAVDQGHFRQDLLFRLNTFVLALPPLRERKADIPSLAAHFLSVFSEKYRRDVNHISELAMESLMNYHWPGNIRELSHVMERAVLLARDGMVQGEQIMLQSLAPKENPPSQSGANEEGELRYLEDIEQEMIERALRTFDGQISKTAEALGISRNALYRRMEKFGIDKDRVIASE